MKNNSSLLSIFKTVLALLLLMHTTCILAGGQKKPNFVLIIADDVSWDDFGCYGNQYVKTRNIDHLAEGGFLFNNVFLTASSCSPSRCSIISGKYPHSNGAAELHIALPESEIPFPLLLRKNGYYTAHAGKWHMGDPAHRAFDIYTDKNGYDIGDGGEANWVEFLQGRPKDKPFFFWLASKDAHRFWGADTFMITHHPDSLEVPVYLNDDPETRRDIASYYNEIARFDYYIGQVVSELEKQGVLENTMIIVMADNGRPFPRCKTRVYDSGMKTPFVVYWQNGIKNPGTQTESLISSIDISSTLLELAGINQPDDYQGISFLPILNNPDAKTREYVFSEHNFHSFEAYERMLRSKDFLYVWNARPNLSNCGPFDVLNSPSQHSLDALRDMGKLTPAQADIYMVPRPEEELFDLSLEQEQLLNVASLERYHEKLIFLRGILQKWMQETGDTTPDDLTPDWYDRETREPLPEKGTRGTMPGTL